MQRTPIEWADYSANPIKFTHPAVRGQTNLCVPRSSGCANCYASAITKRFKGVKYTQQVMDQAQLVLDEPELRHMLKARPKPPKGSETFVGGRDRPCVFVCDMTDPFGPWVPYDVLDQLFGGVALRRDIDWMLLTKWPDRAAEYLVGASGRIADQIMAIRRASGDRGVVAPLPHVTPGRAWWPLPNVWLGTSVESQEVIHRVEQLGRCPAAIRFISMEPLIGYVELPLSSAGVMHLDDIGGMELSAPDADPWFSQPDWVIAGGESGPGARPMHPDWVRGLRDQCQAAGVPFFFKQWGAWQRGSDRGIDEERHTVMLADGCRYGWDQVSSMEVAPQHIGRTGSWKPGLNPQVMAPVGKKRAGRLLDGREWNEMPQRAGVGA